MFEPDEGAAAVDTGVLVCVLCGAAVALTMELLVASTPALLSSAALALGRLTGGGGFTSTSLIV